MEKLTIKEIARIAGVSPSAVSIVLNGRKGVSKDTRRKISELVDKLQYAPNPSSRRLIFNKTNNIALLFKKSVHPLDHLFYSELSSAIINECEKRGYNLVFTSAHIENNSVQLSNVIRSHDVDGIILYGDIDPLIANALDQFPIPRVLVDTHSNRDAELCVSADYEAAAYFTAKHLIGLGHTKIAFIGNHALQNHHKQTFSGFRRAVEEKDIHIPVNWIRFEAYDEQKAAECMDEILRGSSHPTAVFCSADIYAIGTMRSIKDHRLRIPDDISVTGIDDILLSQYTEPALTTARIDKKEMGRLAIDLLIKRIEGEAASSTMIIPDNLVIRTSTAPASR